MGRKTKNSKQEYLNWVVALMDYLGSSVPCNEQVFWNIDGVSIIAEYNTPQNNPHHKYDLLGHTKHVIEALAIFNKYEELHKELVLAALYHDVGKASVKTVNLKTGYDQYIGHADKSVEILKGLRSEYSEISDEGFEYALELIRLHDTKYTKVSKILNMIETHPAGFADDLIRLQHADIMGQSDYKFDEKMAQLVEFAENINSVQPTNYLTKFIDFNKRYSAKKKEA